LKNNKPKINLDKISKKFLKDKEKEFVLKKQEEYKNNKMIDASSFS
jgi:hypothetical protein